MLSYRHAYHAGNHADVLKHWLLVLCLQYLKQKPKPLFYLDTHAGAGSYALQEARAEKTGEYREGIGRLWSATAIPDVFRDYLDYIHHLNPTTLRYYPGSPQLAAALLRDDDSLRLVERHPADLDILRRNLSSDRRTGIIDGDGFAQIKALLPPQSRRGLVLIDPPYEEKADYQRVLTALGDGLKRFATGTYLVWYPLLNSRESLKFAEQLRGLSGGDRLNVQLRVTARPEDHGMYGSGMWVINPPYMLHDQLQQGLPWLVKNLGRDEAAGFTLEAIDGGR